VPQIVMVGPFPQDQCAAGFLKRGVEMTRRVFAVPAAIVVFGALTALPVSAHHSFAAAFDANALITVQGVITQVKLANPALLDLSRRQGRERQRRAVGVRSTDADGAHS
jgi:hypothetical protein